MRFAAAALLVCLFASAAGAKGAPSFRELEESLTCQCGCGLTVHACNHLACPSAVPLREEIRAQMQLGKSEEEILAYFAGKYGEKILSAPTASGFNLAAWVTPFLALGVGGGIVAVALMRWRRRGEAMAAEQSPAISVPRYREIFEREIEKFSE